MKGLIKYYWGCAGRGISVCVQNSSSIHSTKRVGEGPRCNYRIVGWTREGEVRESGHTYSEHVIVI